jgi:hypothetical protein
MHQRRILDQPGTLPAALRHLGAYVIGNGRLLRISNYEFAGPEIAFRIEFAWADRTPLENDLSKPAIGELSIRCSKRDDEAGRTEVRRRALLRCSFSCIVNRIDQGAGG